MAHLAAKRYSYWGQLGIFAALIAGGFIAGGLLSILPLLGKINLNDIKNFSGKEFMDAVLKPENANAIRLMQFIATLFMFFVPAYFYAKICHGKATTHLGFTKAPAIPQIAIIIAIMFFSLFIIGALQELWNQIPFPKQWADKFAAAENDYKKQLAVMARMNGFGDYLLSLLIVALLPAVFEETIFRGALQNLLSRWFKMPILAVTITAIIFSIAHGSYDGFLARFLLGFVLGWLFYRTGNLWLSIIGHFLNNAIGITTLYLLTDKNKAVDLSKVDQPFPVWLGIVGVVAVIGLLIALDKVSKHDIDKPGEEVPMFGYDDPRYPLWTDIKNIGKSNH
jgi:membrane protease YdiL (CAAX protease family)